MEIIRAISLVALLVAMASHTGCASAPVAPSAVSDIDKILASRTFGGDEPPTEPAAIKAALQKARAEILADKTAIQKAEKKAENNAAWARRGKGFVLCGGVCGVFILLGIGGVICRRFIG